MPEVGKTVVGKGDSFAVVESVKAASDVYAPVSGEVDRGQRRPVDRTRKPSTRTAEADGLVRQDHQVSDASQLDALMDQAAYDAFLATL